MLNEAPKFKKAGWLSYLYAVGLIIPLGNTPWKYLVIQLFSLTIFPYIFLKLGEYFNSTEKVKKTISLLILFQVSAALLSLSQFFALVSEEFAPVTFNIYTILILAEGFLFCLLGRELKKIKELKINAILIILGITYLILGAFSFRLFARLLTILATIVLFYFLGKFFLRGEEEVASSNILGKFFKRMLYVAGFFFVLVLIISVIDYYSSRNQNIKEITYTNLLQEVDQGAIERVSITDKYLRGKLKNGQEFSVILPQDASPLIETMHKRNIAISFNKPPAPPWWKALWER